MSVPAAPSQATSNWDWGLVQGPLGIALWPAPATAGLTLAL